MSYVPVTKENFEGRNVAAEVKQVKREAIKFMAKVFKSMIIPLIDGIAESLGVDKYTFIRELIRKGHTIGYLLKIHNVSFTQIVSKIPTQLLALISDVIDKVKKEDVVRFCDEDLAKVFEEAGEKELAKLISESELAKAWFTQSIVELYTLFKKYLRVK